MRSINDITGGQDLRYFLRDKLNPRDWVREAKYANQRRKRGYSDRDTWDGGSFILEICSGVLKKLDDNKSHTDWDEYFKTNYPNNLGYNSLKEVAADLDAYLAFQESTSLDDLGFEIKHGTKPVRDSPHLVELVNLNTPEENRQIRQSIERHREKEEVLYRNAKKAMWFIAVNFRCLWD